MLGWTGPGMYDVEATVVTRGTNEGQVGGGGARGLGAKQWHYGAMGGEDCCGAIYIGRGEETRLGRVERGMR